MNKSRKNCIRKIIFIISNKIVPKISLQDLILKYSEIFKKKKSIKLLAEENDFYNLEDGERWLKSVFKFKEKNWLDLFKFLPEGIVSLKMKKSAILSLLLASLDNVNQGKILINQKDHFDKIMVRLK